MRSKIRKLMMQGSQVFRDLAILTSADLWQLFRQLNQAGSQLACLPNYFLKFLSAPAASHLKLIVRELCHFPF
jgi:hypothetical protein